MRGTNATSSNAARHPPTQVFRQNASPPGLSEHVWRTRDHNKSHGEHQQDEDSTQNATSMPAASRSYDKEKRLMSDGRRVAQRNSRSTFDCAALWRKPPAKLDGVDAGKKRKESTLSGQPSELRRPSSGVSLQKKKKRSQTAMWRPSSTSCLRLSVLSSSNSFLAEHESENSSHVL